MKKVIFLIVFIITPISFADKSPAEKFQEMIGYANSLRNKIKTEKDSSLITVEGASNVKPLTFNPQEVFKNQPGGYTQDPPQGGYYQEVIQGNTH